MNVNKIMNEVLKNVDKGCAFKTLICEAGEYIIVGSDHHLYRINRDDFLLDVEKIIKAGAKNVTSFAKMFDVAYKAPQLNCTGYTIKTNDKRQLIELKQGDDVVYIDEKLTKLFDSNCTFGGNGPKNPVYVYEFGEPVGLILPVTNVKQN